MVPADVYKRQNNAQEIYLKELGSESPMLVRLIMKSIHKQNKREVKHIGCKRLDVYKRQVQDRAQVLRGGNRGDAGGGRHHFLARRQGEHHQQPVSYTHLR